VICTKTGSKTVLDDMGQIIPGYLQAEKRKDGCKPVLASYPSAILITNADIVAVYSDRGIDNF